MRNIRRKPTRAQLKERRKHGSAKAQKHDAEIDALIAANLEKARSRAAELYGPEPLDGFTEDQLDHARYTFEIERERADAALEALPTEGPREDGSP